MIDAGAIEAAFGVDRALGPAVGRQPQKARYARAHRMLVDHTTIAIQAARRRNARVLSRYRQIGFLGF